MPDCAKKYQSYKLKGQICLPLRKKTTTQSGDPGGKKVPTFSLFVLWLTPDSKHWDVTAK